MNRKLKFGALVSGTTGLATIFGANLARMNTNESRPLDNVMISRERHIYNSVDEIHLIEQMNLKKRSLSTSINKLLDYQASNVYPHLIYWNLIP